MAPPTSDHAESILLDINYNRVRRDNHEEAEIVLHLRNILNGQRSRELVKIKENPYFYVTCDQDQLDNLLTENDILADWYIKSEPVERIKYNRGESINLLKITGRQPWKVPTIRTIFELNHINYYEADIPFTHRFMIDHQMKGLQQISIDNNTYETRSTNFLPVICSFDIEVDFGESDEMSFGELIEEAGRRITAIGISYNHEGEIITKSFVLDEDSDSAEITFLKEFFYFLWHAVDPDIIITYNGDNFDWPYLIARFESLKIPTDIISPTGSNRPKPPSYGNGWIIPGVLVYDLYHSTKWMYTEDGRKTLDSVAEALLGTHKLEMELDHGQMWRRSLKSEEFASQFRKYVDRDAEITRNLFNAMNIDDWLEVIKICGAPPGEAINFTERQSGEFLVFQIMYANKILIPPAPTTEERRIRKQERKSAKGGLVIDPIRDLSNAVLIADFASMYPSIIKAFNIGGESFKSTKFKPTNRFNAEPQTSMAKMQTQMLSTRSKVKEQLRKLDRCREE